MPPRIRPSNFSSAVAPCPSARSQSIPQPARLARDFSQSSPQQVTARRRAFYQWLNGPGSQLKEPLPNSTNYLAAYDRYGNLRRAGPGYRRKTQAELAKEKARAEQAVSVDDKVKTEQAPGEASSGQEAVNELEASLQRSEENKRDNEAQEQKLAPETLEDLRPFPLNKHFRSQPVLSEDLREAIYQRVVRDGATVALASVEFGVSNERVAAVVRLKQVEKEWVAEGKTLAVPYAKAVLEMLPTTPFIDPSKPQNAGRRPIVHEPINDLPVHPATRQQLFVPTSESRQFTREDAAKAFDNDLLPADDRIPHPELVLAERELAQGMSFSERRDAAIARLEAEQEKKAQEEAKRKAFEDAKKTVPKRRWDFVFQDVSVEHAGKDGRGAKGVGWRYGFPHEDRKKGQVKIPTKVEA